MKSLTIVLGILLYYTSSTFSLELITYFSQHGLHGEIKFIHLQDNYIKIKTNLQTTLEYPNQIWSWGVSEFPVDYTDLENRCSDQQLGRTLVEFDDKYGYLELPENKTIEIITKELQITGDRGLYGKSLVLRATDSNKVACSSITIADKFNEKVAVAKFHTSIAGHVYFRWIATADNHRDTLIQTDLYHVAYNDTKTRSPFTEHKWKIFVTDIFNADDSRSEDNCNILQLVFDPENKGQGKSVGDVDTRVGPLKVATDYNRQQYKSLFRDNELMLLPSDLSGPQRRLHLVIYDYKHKDSFLACAKIHPHQPIKLKTIIQGGGLKGDVTFSQNSRFDPTFVDFNLVPARGDLESKLIYGSKVGGYKIHELPPIPAKTEEQLENPCKTTKLVYNPTNINAANVPPDGFGTQDQYQIGDLSGKLLTRNNASNLIPGSFELRGLYWDIFLPLQSIYSIAHRSLVIYQNIDNNDADLKQEPWICGNIVFYESNLKYHRPIFTAEVIFRYPLVGRILLRQPKDDPLSDTTILIETLVHADGSQLNNSMEHRWAVHDLPPGKDFYNWTARCLSSGNISNPYKVLFDPKNPSEGCSLKTIGLCRLGDLSTRLGTLDIAGRKIHGSKISRKMFTDVNLPLTGTHKVLGKSLVIYDDHGPVARGERLACSIIAGVYRRKAVAKDWHDNGDPITIKGKIEFLQQTEYDITNVEVNYQDLNDNGEYHIHVTPVESHLAFPCERTTLYDIWNPLQIDASKSPRHYFGTTDEYEMGNLSGKFGSLENHTIYKTSYNDTMLPLFGPRSIIGRSVLIHKKTKRRWACATIERGYSPSEARELRAIASFHHPGGFAYGYIRMTQLIYNDKSKSETVIEVKLRHPGKNDRNVTRNHNWAVFVNPVSVDATVQIYGTRCVAGGYMWNPFYTQLADPLNQDLYREECGPDNPLRCYVGDISGRLGTIDLGLKRKVFTDSNLPLEGDVTAIGRSIVIFSPNKGSDRFACANIEPDYDIIKYANIEKPPRFVLAQFIEDVRAVMGIPEWMLTVDKRNTKILHSGGCIQFLMHFKGPIAGRLELDFTLLLVNGRLDSPSLYIPGYINTKRKSKLSYRQCDVTDPNEKRNKNTRKYFSSGTSKPYLNKLFVIYFFILKIYLL